MGLDINGNILVKCDKSEVNVIIPDGVTKISGSAFDYCKNLESIKIPNSVTTIEKGAFKNCENLQEIIVDVNNPNFSSIDGILYNKEQTSLIFCPVTKKAVIIPNSVTIIGEGAFHGCKNLQTIEIPNSVTTIGQFAFCNCKNLQAIEISNSVITIEKGAFRDCEYLQSIKIPNSVTTIGQFAFYNCKNLQSIEIPNSVINIGERVFGDCESLQLIQIPNSVTTIGEGAFHGCKNLQTIKLPDSVTEIGYGTFAECENLQSIEIPNSVINIGERVFWDCESLQLIQIPNSVTTIGEGAFLGCRNLQSIEIPNSVTNIGNSAFKDCKNLQSIKMPNIITEIGERYFENFKKLKEFKIPDSVTTIGERAFEGCENLQLIEIHNSVTTIGDYAFFGCRNLQSIEIPNSVTNIGNSAFEDCRNLQSIKLPNSVTEIGYGTFAGCENLKSIEIPNSVTNIRNGAFGVKVFSSGSYIKSCKNLQSIKIPDSVTEIGNCAFLSCENLKEVLIGKNLNNIGCDIFLNCHNLEKIYIINNFNRFTNEDFGVGSKCEIIYLLDAETKRLLKTIKAKKAKQIYSNYGFVSKLSKYIPIVNEFKIDIFDGKFDDRDLFGRIRTQGLLGTCWAFAGCESLQSNKYDHEIEFSPLHLAYIKGSYNGGSHKDIMAYLNNWQGPVLEEDFPYEEADKIAKDVFEEKKDEIIGFLFDFFKEKIINNKITFGLIIECILFKSKYNLKFFTETEKYKNLRNIENDFKFEEKYEEYEYIVGEMDNKIDNIIYPEITKRIKKAYKNYEPKVYGICENAYYLTYDKKAGDNPKETLTDFEIKSIKKKILENKAVSISIKSPKNYYDTFVCKNIIWSLIHQPYSVKNYDIFVWKDIIEPATHSLTIIGWNDEIPKEKFYSSQLEKDGAFLIKNSWGEDAHDKGYFWLSYYDKTLTSAIAFDFPIKKEEAPYNKQLNHCEICALDEIEDFEAKYGKVVYKPEESGSIKALRSYFYVGNVDCKFIIKINGVEIENKTLWNDYPGYKTIYLDKEIEFNAGDIIEVIGNYNVKGISNGDKLPIAKVEEVPTGLSYYSNDGVNFEDLADKKAILGLALLY